MTFGTDRLYERYGAAGIVACAERESEWIFEGLIEKRDQWLISGAPKSGKSRLALQLALAASEQKSFLGYESPRKIKVLYIDFELKEETFSKRVLNFYPGGKAEFLKNNYFFRCSDYKQIDVSSRPDCADLDSLIGAISPDLIVWDVLARAHSVDENSNIAMSQVMQSIRQLSRDAAHIIVHHARKEIYGNGGAKALRGASSIHGEADGVMSIAIENSSKGSHSLVFSTRAVETPAKIWLTSNGLSFSKANYQNVPAAETLNRILANAFVNHKSLSKPELTKALAVELKVSERQVERKIKELILMGSLKKTKVGREVVYEL